jgi:hypothetical protein
MCISISGLNVTNMMSRRSVIESSDDEDEGLVMKSSTTPKVSFYEYVEPT